MTLKIFDQSTISPGLCLAYKMTMPFKPCYSSARLLVGR